MKLDRYDPGWPVEFEKERLLLESALGALAQRIEHVGSTAIPGLQAKPVIDIQVSVERLDVALFENILEPLGYRYLRMERPLDDVYPFFHKPARWPTTHHVHFCVSKGEQERLHVAFRDWLRCNPEDRSRYGRLKDQLAQAVDESKVETLFEYTERKGAFVDEIVGKAIKACMG